MSPLLGEGRNIINPRTYAIRSRDDNPYTPQKDRLRTILFNLLEYGVGQFAARIFFGKKQLVWPNKDLQPATEITAREIVDQLVKKGISPTIFRHATQAIETQLINNYNAGHKFEVHLAGLATEKLVKKGLTEDQIQQFYRLDSAEKVAFLAKTGVVKIVELARIDINYTRHQGQQLDLIPAIPVQFPKS